MRCRVYQKLCKGEGKYWCEDVEGAKEAFDEIVQMYGSKALSSREAVAEFNSRTGLSCSYQAIVNAWNRWVVEQRELGKEVDDPRDSRKRAEKAYLRAKKGEINPRQANARERRALAEVRREKRDKKVVGRKKALLSSKIDRTSKHSTSSKTGRIVSEEELLKAPTEVVKEIEEKVVFQPNAGPQTDFLAAPETDVLYGGQAGGGKSFALIIDPLRYIHRAAHRALILRKTMPELREIIDKTRELYPQAVPGCKYKEVEKRWIFPSGATIEFGYLERDADVYRYQGQAYSLIAFDELTHLATEFPWNYLASRLRTTDPEIECYLRATTNPGGVGHMWVKSRYIDPASPNTTFVGADGLTRKFIPATLHDNPYLAKDGNYERMLRSLPEVQRRRLLEGDWNINEGAAFPEFSNYHHVIDPFTIPPSWVRVKGVDYGYASPSAVVWGALDPSDDTLIIYKELYQKGLTGEDLGQRIVELEAEERRSIPGVLDTAAWNRTGYTGPTIGETLNREPYMLKLRPADKNRIAGKVAIHQRLKRRIMPDGELGRPKLQIFSTCKNLIRELYTLPLSETNSEDVDTKAEDHAYDALRYLVMSRPSAATAAHKQFHIHTHTWSPSDAQFGY